MISKSHCRNLKVSGYDQEIQHPHTADQPTTLQGRAATEHLSHNMRFLTMWYVRPAKTQTSLCIRAVCSEPLQVP